MASPGSPQQKLNDQLSALAQLDKAIARRVVEAEKAEASLAKRMELLAKAEASLHATLNAAQVAARDTVPMLKALPQIKASIEVAKAVASDWPARRQQIDQDLADLRDYVHRCSEGCKDDLSDHAAGLVKDLNGASKAFGEQVVQQLDEADAITKKMMASLDQRVSAAQQEWDALEADVQDRLKQSMQRATTQINAVTAPLLRKLEESLGEKEFQLAQRVNQLQHELSRQIAAVQAKLMGRAAELETGLGEAGRFFNDESARLLQEIHRSVTDRLTSMEVEARLAMRPILTRIEDTREAAQRQIDLSIDTAEQLIAARLGEIRRDAWENVELAERELLSRVKAIEPRAQSVLDEAEGRLRQRMDSLAQNVGEAIETVEKQPLLPPAGPRVASVEVTILDEATKRLKRATPSERAA